MQVVERNRHDLSAGGAEQVMLRGRGGGGRQECEYRYGNLYLFPDSGTVPPKAQVSWLRWKSASIGKQMKIAHLHYATYEAPGSAVGSRSAPDIHPNSRPTLTCECLDCRHPWI